MPVTGCSAQNIWHGIGANLAKCVCNGEGENYDNFLNNGRPETEHHHATTTTTASAAAVAGVPCARLQLLMISICCFVILMQSAFCCCCCCCCWVFVLFIFHSLARAQCIHKHMHTYLLIHNNMYACTAYLLYIPHNDTTEHNGITEWQMVLQFSQRNREWNRKMNTWRKK